MNVFFKIIENMEGIPVPLILFLAVVISAYYIVKILNTPGHFTDWLFLRKRKGLADTPDDSLCVLFDPIKKQIYKREEFRSLTGINIHPDKIGRLIQLRDSSGGNYDWPQIKAALSFVVFGPDRCRVEISIFNKVMDWFVKIVFIVPMVLFFLMALYLAFLSMGQEVSQHELAIAAIGCMIGTIITALLYGYLRRDIVCARLIQRTIDSDGVAVMDSSLISKEVTEERGSQDS